MPVWFTFQVHNWIGWYHNDFQKSRRAFEKDTYLYWKSAIEWTKTVFWVPWGSAVSPQWEIVCLLTGVAIFPFHKSSSVVHHPCVGHAAVHFCMYSAVTEACLVLKTELGLAGVYRKVLYSKACKSPLTQIWRQTGSAISLCGLADTCLGDKGRVAI